MALNERPDRIYFTLPSGDRLPLPLVPWNPQEFSLPGNCIVFGDAKLVAFYDGESRTGAIFINHPSSPCWKLIQPCVRDEFFSHAELDFELLGLCQPQESR